MSGRIFRLRGFGLREEQEQVCKKRGTIMLDHSMKV